MIGNWKAIKDANGELLGGRTTVQIKDAWRTMVQRGDVSTELSTSGRKKSKGKKSTTAAGGKGTKRAAEESDGDSDDDDKKPVAVAVVTASAKTKSGSAKKRKVSQKEDAPSSDSDDSLPEPAFAKSTISNSTNATSAGQRIESVNARHPPSVGAVMRSVRPLQAITGVSTNELVRLTQSVRVLGDEVERSAVEAVIGASPSNRRGASKQETGDNDAEVKESNARGGIATHWVIVVLILLAIGIYVLAMSEVLHIFGSMFIVGTTTSDLSGPPSSILARSVHDSITPRSRRLSQRVYDHTSMLSTTLVASMEGLLVTSSHDADKEEKEERHHPQIRPPRRSTSPSVMERAGLYVTHRLMGLTEPTTATVAEGNEAYDKAPLSTMTLRQFLSDGEGFHLGMAPAFFGFYAYFGALTALNEELLQDEDEGKVVLPTKANLSRYPDDAPPNVLLKSVAGASAGAMAAVFLSAGADPRDAADACLDLTFGEVADYGGFGAALKGYRFEAIMKEKLEKIGRTSNFKESVLPVAVSGFDLLSMSGQLLDNGCMAKAARASATFPGLFQPVGWNDEDVDDEAKLLPDNLLIDGGIRDLFGLNGLSILLPDKPKRIVNMVVGDFGSLTPGPLHMPKDVDATEVVSISLLNTPKCGPWAMEMGPIAVEAARKAVSAVLDAPMHMGVDPGHYELHIDASEFV